MEKGAVAGIKDRRDDCAHEVQQGERAITNFLGGIGFAGALVLLAGFIALVLFEMLREDLRV